MNDMTGKRPRGTRWCSTGIYAATIGVALIVIGLAGARVGLLGPLASFGAFGIGLLACLVAVISGGIGLAISKGSAGAVSSGKTWAAVVASLTVFVISLGMRPDTAGAPPIHDISTDTEAPPQFVDVIPLRKDAPNPPEYAGADAAAAQKAAFPDLTTFRSTRPRAEVYDAAVKAVADMGWEPVASDQATGRIEATAVTSWFRFRDDVVIRVAATEGGTKVDVRSKSRVGQGDMGANAARIRAYLEKLEANLN